MSEKGIFIVVDGIDGAGKTTQVERFADLFRSAGEAVTCSKEPTQGVWGAKLRESATKGRLPVDEELELFIRDRQEHVDNLINPAIAAGGVVIVDRYYYSTIAYQGARGANVDALVTKMHEMFPTPDVAFFLDLPAELAVHRIANERGDQPNEFERVDSLREIRGVFNRIAFECKEVAVIDSTPNEDAVSSAIAQALINGVIEAKRCGKDYGCEKLYCGLRSAGECRWAEIKKVFEGQSRSA